MKQRILIFAGYFLPYSGGYANSIFQLARRLVARGQAVTVVTSNTEGAAAEEVLDGVRVLRMPCWHLLSGTFPVPKFSRANFRLLRRLATEGFTVVNTQTRFFFLHFSASSSRYSQAFRRSIPSVVQSIASFSDELLMA